MVDPFFQLKGQTTAFGDNGSFFAMLNDRTIGIIENSQYSPDILSSPISPRVWRIRDKKFSNFSFSKTEISDIEFQNCQFEQCLFMGTIFSNCRFTDCFFTNCNVHRLELRNVYVTPKAFADCILSKQYANIGVHLFQELLRNSRQQAQPDHADAAQYMFRRWQRFLNQDELRQLPRRQRARKAIAIAASWSFEFFLGSGVRLSNLAGTTVGLIVGLSMLHWRFSDRLGLSAGTANIQSFVDSFYFTAVTLTTLGYGDITPSTELGRVVVGFEALLGFVLFATFASTVFRKFSS
ncbi:ion channel [Mesorhizobium caraganae]|uniref:ion channel n=1 Tax=Mesorhizobium caraganae TaxID=483206 RepID=UPI003ECD8448